MDRAREVASRARLRGLDALASTARSHVALGLVALAMLAVLPGCKRPDASAADAGADASASVAAPPASAMGQNSVAPPPPDDRPRLGVTSFVGTVYAEPRDTARKLGYLRVGAIVARAPEPAGTAGCPGGWYELFPRGFVCVGKDATLDLSDPILKAAAKRPNLKTALPYRYAFVRAVAPLYLRIPTRAEQLKSEFKLEEHLAWYKENEAVVSQVTLGAHDVPLDNRGVPLPSKKLGELGLGKNSLEVPLGVHLGGETDSDAPPFWLEGGKRTIPNISDFQVPEYAVFADRVRRHTGLALVGSFPTGPESLDRRFAITTDLRLAPGTKIKPDTGSPWHGVELGPDLTLPLAFVRQKAARAYTIEGRTPTPADEIGHRSVHALTGTMKVIAGVRYYRTKDKRWLSEQDVGVALAPAPWPDDAEKGKKWVDVSITQQTLVMWEGKTPIYATLVSTGKDGMDDPKTSHATVRGIFKIRNKHITATMDSNESSSVGGSADRTSTLASTSVQAPDSGASEEDEKPAKKAAAASDSSKARSAGKSGKSDKAKGPASKNKASAPAAKSKKSPGDVKPKAAAKQDATAKHAPEYVPKRGDGVYGVTRRRGEGTFQLKDVPYIQYFAAGYALHAAYWHDVFGTPRSHGCVNLSPVDAHRLFLWTEPAVPDGWHAVNAGDEFGEGTTVVIRE